LFPLGHDIGWLPPITAVKAPSTILTDKPMLTDHPDEAGKCSAGPSSWRIGLQRRRKTEMRRCTSGPQALGLMAPRLYTARSTASPPPKRVYLILTGHSHLTDHPDWAGRGSAGTSPRGMGLRRRRSVSTRRFGTVTSPGMARPNPLPSKRGNGTRTAAVHAPPPPLHRSMWNGRMHARHWRSNASSVVPEVCATGARHIDRRHYLLGTLASNRCASAICQI